MQDLFYDMGKLERVLSEARLKGYQTGYAKKLNLNPVSLYRWNILLSESLYPLLHILEVGLRNSIYGAVTKQFGNANWLLEPEQFLDPLESKVVQKQVESLEHIGKLDPGHLIAELSFGFWCSLLDRRYEHQQLLWPTLLRAVFPYLENRKIHLIRARFNRIRRLRNRVYHYEPTWHWQDLLKQHDEILEAISWLEPELLKLLEIDRFGEIYRMGPH